MEEYINSGITWIGEIPSSWKVNKIKAMASLSGRIGWQGLTSEEYTDEGAYLITGVDFDNGKINWESCVHVPMKRWKEATSVQIRENDLLITKDGTVGKVALAENMPYETSLNSGVLLIRPSKDYVNKFLFYILQSDVFWTWFNLDNAGNSTIIHLYQHDFNNFAFPYPNLQEQIAIANFLDKKCVSIDAILRDINAQIECLIKRKKSVIWECVTKGIDSTVKTKNSNEDWIGAVPEHYSIKRIKYIATLIGSGGTPDTDNLSYYENGSLNWIQSGDLYKNDYVTSTEKKITHDAVKSMSALKLYSKDFVVVAMYGASVGNTSISMIDSYVNQACCVLKFENDCLRYMYYALKSSNEYLLQQAIGGTQPNISQIIIKNTKIPVPPIDEQRLIASYLDEKCNAIDALITKKQLEFEKLEKYKKSLIYEYITGKKRVEEQ